MNEAHGLGGCLQHLQVVARRNRHKPTLIELRAREKEELDNTSFLREPSHVKFGPMSSVVVAVATGSVIASFFLVINVKACRGEGGCGQN